MQRRDFLLGAALAGAFLAPAAFAQAANSKTVVDAAKAAGVVGEQADGFLGIVSGGDGAVQAAVAEINAGRAQVYREAAAKSGATPAAAGASAFVTTIQPRLAPGTYYKPNGGGWTKK